MSPHVHTIPVPAGMTADDAWAEICILGRLYRSADDGCGWANVICDDTECRIEQEPSA